MADHPAHPDYDLEQYNKQIEEFLHRRANEIAPLVERHQNTEGPAHVLATIEMVNHARETFTEYCRWFEGTAGNWRAAGRLDEFLAMRLVRPSDEFGKAIAESFRELRDACAARKIDSRALTTAASGINDCQDGILELAPQEADGTKPERHDRARAKMANGYLVHGQLPKDGVDDTLAHLRVACEGEIAEAEFPEPPVNGTATTKSRGRLPKRESEAKLMELLARASEHPTLANDPKALGEMVGVSESTARRWLEVERRKYQESAAPNPKQ